MINTLDPNIATTAPSGKANEETTPYPVAYKVTYSSNQLAAIADIESGKEYLITPNHSRNPDSNQLGTAIEYPEAYLHDNPPDAEEDKIAGYAIGKAEEVPMPQLPESGIVHGSEMIPSSDITSSTANKPTPSFTVTLEEPSNTLNDGKRRYDAILMSSPNHTQERGGS